MAKQPPSSSQKVFRLLGPDNERIDTSQPGQFAGHRKLRIYGRLDCPNALRWIAEGHYVQHRVFFLDEETAIAAGFRPCAICMTQSYEAWKKTNGKTNR